MRFRCESCGAQYAISDEKLGKKGVKVRCKKCSNIITVRPPAPEPEPSQEQAQEPAQDEDQRDTTSVDSDPSVADQEGRDESEYQTESQPSGADDEDPSSESEGLDLGDDGDLHDALNGLLGDELGDDLEDEDEQDADMDRQATRVFNVEEMQQVQSEREQAIEPGEDDSQESSSHGSLGEDESGAGAEQNSASQSSEDRDKVEWYAAVDDEQAGPMSLNEFAQRWKNGEFDSDTLVWKSGFEDWLTVYDVAAFAFLAEEDSPGGDEESEIGEDAGSDWSPSFGAQSEPDSPDEQEQDEAYGDQEEEDEDEYEDDVGGAYSGFDEEESSSTASSAAFAADVDWKPAALSSLSDLAEQELASLKPEDPEPEDELPFDPDGELPSGDGLEFDGEMEDGDSSLVAQIAAEEESIRKAQEEQEEQVDEPDRPSEGDGVSVGNFPEMNAQEKARKEKRAEQVVAASVPQERYIPPRSSLPKWAIGLMIGGGLMMLTLVGVVGFLLARKVPEKSTQPVEVAAPVTPSNNSTTTQPAKNSLSGQKKQPSANSNDVSGTQVASKDGANVKNPGESKGTVKNAGSVPISPSKNPTGGQKIAANVPPKKDTKPKVKPRQNKSAARKKRRKKTSTHVAMAPKEEKVIEKPKPKHRKAKGGLLDFEDPDDRAFAAEAGIKAPKTAPKVEKKKALPPLSNADVLTVMKRHLAEFKACNRKQKEVDSTVRGKMVVNFTIGNNGKVVKIGVSKKTAKFNGTYVGGCIKSIIKRLRFPEFGGPKKTIPFPFTVN